MQRLGRPLDRRRRLAGRPLATNTADGATDTTGTFITPAGIVIVFARPSTADSSSAVVRTSRAEEAELMHRLERQAELRARRRQALETARGPR